MTRKLSEIARRQAENFPRFATLPELRRLCASAATVDRLRALWLMRCQLMQQGVRRAVYLPLARQLITDKNNDCRWQALIVVGEFIRPDPEAVWEVTCEYGVSNDEDMRDGVATVLLEHLLEHHFTAMFPRVRELAMADQWFADTFGRCWWFGQAKEPRNRRRVNALLDRLRRRWWLPSDASKVETA